MPRKSVWEMSAAERLNHSLSARTFRVILIFASIIEIAAAALGFTFYNDAITRDYRIRTMQLSKTAVIDIPIEDIRAISQEVLDVYDSRNGEGAYDNDDLSDYSFVMDEKFASIRQTIRTIQTENDAIAGYAAALDPVSMGMIFIIDGDPTANFCPPGQVDEMKPEYIKAFIEGTTGSFLDPFYGTEPMPSIVTRMKQYGYRCTAGTKLFDVNGYPVMLFFDTDMNKAAVIARTFIWQFFLVMTIITVTLAILLIRRMRKTIIVPINRLTDAAQEYSRNKMEGTAGGGCFSRIDIHTGDELENLGLTMKAMEEEISVFEEDLTRVTAEKERMNTELRLASLIQEGMLPHIFPPYPDRPEFDLYASMDPAREVGGDFYDFYFIDDDHLALVIADVSGKGIPASLFMMISKTLIKTCIQSGDSPSEALANVNRQLLEGNDAEMFVTVWLAILEISTGKGIVVNAGHEHPALSRAGEQFELIKYRHSPGVGMLEGITFREHEFQLYPGDCLFVYTDGVPEAINEKFEPFGTDRLLDSLNANAARDPKSILERMTADIYDFCDGTEQFDDCTMLCLKYKGPKDNGTKDAAE